MRTWCLAMPSWKYSITDLDPDRTAIASGRDLRISFKHAREICNTIKGMMLEDAKKFLKEVIEMKRPVPFRRFHRKVGHRRGLKGWPAGRYPVKAAKKILEVLENVTNNAMYKGLDPEKCKIIHACAHKGPVIRKYIPRAFGRSTPYFQQLTHVEIAVEEVE